MRPNKDDKKIKYRRREKLSNLHILFVPLCLIVYNKFNQRSTLETSEKILMKSHSLGALFLPLGHIFVLCPEKWDEGFSSTLFHECNQAFLNKHVMNVHYVALKWVMKRSGPSEGQLVITWWWRWTKVKISLGTELTWTHVSMTYIMFDTDKLWTVSESAQIWSFLLSHVTLPFFNLSEPKIQTQKYSSGCYYMSQTQVNFQCLHFGLQTGRKRLLTGQIYWRGYVWIIIMPFN